MLYEEVKIKQLPDDLAVAHGLDKYNKSKMPGTFDYFQAGVGPDGRYVTGIDENAYEVNAVDDKEFKEELKIKRQALRESLEKLTGIEDLSGKSPFWKNYIVSIPADREIVLSRTNPMDVIKYHVLIANRYVAPNKALASEPEYLSSKYYCFVDERETAEDVSTQKLRDSARSELYRLTENHELAVLLGQYLEGDKYKIKLKPDSVYKMLSDFINKDAESLHKFLKAVKANQEELQFKVAIDRAIKRRLIRVRDGYYQRGQVTLGRNLPEVYANLRKPEFATEFLSIQDEVSE